MVRGSGSRGGQPGVPACVWPGGGQAKTGRLAQKGIWPGGRRAQRGGLVQRRTKPRVEAWGPGGSFTATMTMTTTTTTTTTCANSRGPSRLSAALGPKTNLFVGSTFLAMKKTRRRWISRTSLRTRRLLTSTVLATYPYLGNSASTCGAPWTFM